MEPLCAIFRQISQAAVFRVTFLGRAFADDGINAVTVSGRNGYRGRDVLTDGHVGGLMGMF